MKPADRILYAISRGLARLSGERVRLLRYHFVAQPVPTESVPAQPRVSKFILYQATTLDSAISSAPRPAGVLERRFRDGAICIVAKRDEALAGFIWIQEAQYIEDEVRCVYRLATEAQAAWDFDVYVEPRYRATRLFAQLWASANEALRSRGYRWTISRISGFNDPSLAAHLRLGIVMLGSGTFLCIGALQFSFFSIRPYFHVSFKVNSVPTLWLPGNPEMLKRGVEAAGRASAERSA